MKISILLTMLVFATTAMAAELSENVIVEHTTNVGFAPVSHRGTFKFQVLESGVVQKIDNKNQKTVLAKLSAELTTKLASAVNNIKSDDLKEPNGPRCSDAPSLSITARQENGTEMTIWKRSGCRDAEPTDETASAVVSSVKELRNALSVVEQL